ncbi:hypothetical protein JCM19231_1781 [Vibrio ishigakensis]|uniref:Uncharacterized protein n=1 Tax=Vibrio ishigakensis TaxID=1481914 RepID=A0A0B8P7X6_9VIBR|nr:hypothetical protein JCM19231_1781 [Vibrio ishigakensis]
MGQDLKHILPRAVGLVRYLQLLCINPRHIIILSLNAYTRIAFLVRVFT